MLLFVATAFCVTSCDEIDDFADDLLSTTEGDIEYVGILTVTDADNKVTYTNAETNFDLEAEDNNVSIDMNGVKFDEGMYMTLDIEVDDITAIKGVFSSDSVVPTIDDEPQVKYTMTNMKGVYTKSTLTMTFNVGTYTVAYVGKVVED